MKLIIDIPEEEYKRMKEQSMFGRVDIWKQAIKNGTPLPKDHGRLIDADKIQFENNEFETYNDYSEAFNAIYFAPTIIEANRSEEE